MKTEEIKRLLRQRYAAPEWAIAFEVANSTGGAARRYADAIAMNLWPSRGFAINGFEIKVSRSDWKKELSQPGKADVIWQFCDFWTLVAPKGVLAHTSELPMGWGYIEAGPNGLRQVVNPEKRDEATPPTKGFVAAMLRRTFDKSDAHFQKEIAAAVAALTAAEPTGKVVLTKRSAPQPAPGSDVRDKYEKLKAERDRFEQLTGIKLSAYNIGGAEQHAERFKTANRLLSNLKILRSGNKRAIEALQEVASFLSIVDPEGGD